MKYLLSVLAFLTFLSPALGKETFSYLYIQGDKQTPFYVKLEGEMQPRFGKNYCIVPQLAAGPTNIEILFQQNAFPPQKFTVLIPEAGSRGFLLVKKEEGFSLYDLQQGFYLPAGNSASDDHVPAQAVPRTAENVTPEMTVAARDTTVVGKAVAAKKPVSKEKLQHKVAKPKPVAAKPVAAAAGPQFIPGIELSKSGESVSETKQPIAPKTMAILNSDCPTAISSTEFKSIFSAMSANSSDEERLGYILGRLDLCYESWQARALAQMLASDAARFTLLKKIYPRITDQGSFPLLDDLLTSETWKAEFARLVHR
jgi:hypothetical protein